MSTPENEPEFPVLNPEDTSDGAFEHRPVDDARPAEQDIEDPSRFTSLVELKGHDDALSDKTTEFLSDTARRFPGIIIEQIDRLGPNGFVQVRFHGATDDVRDEALTYVKERA